jgi:magnesium-transporting ATPase (P-type)
MICFDKTGTLTEDHLDINGFRPVKLSKDIFSFDGFVDNVNQISEDIFAYYNNKMTEGIKDKNKEAKQLFIEFLAFVIPLVK